ncbi:hypothetical protein INH39_22305 [Massilia violaceinigra]|uniref:Alpha/beta hydrolase n=1 Tax=Massilia violaceinigra TaxID=2045208 RepID=A0ABY4AGF8_9BURK|nr:hypothetical protein INH39_22305 [Massilia violaceinigra]
MPVDPAAKQGTVAQGFVTPKQDRTPQVLSIPPRRVLPIIFIPGIMGSNLRLSADRQRELGIDNNIAWRPDHAAVSASGYNDSPIERQRRLDPMATEVDIYDPAGNATGDVDETADERNEEVNPKSLSMGYGRLASGPVIKDDPYGAKERKSAAQKARARGWGEVYYGSYKAVLSLCEEVLNASFLYQRLDPWVERYIVTKAPSEWEAHTAPALAPLGEDLTREALKGCFFPVHAMGYNWLKGNGESGTVIAGRIDALMKRYQTDGYQCEKVILVTHSMGGLVARAVIHPKFGGFNDKVLGIVHGVMPAIGAAAAYRRVRCGFEGSGIVVGVVGAYGFHVTPVLGNAQGGLELLPSCDYGRNWLKVRANGNTLMSLPARGDPYEEIYKVRGKWYNLLREEWINPANADGPGFRRTCALLDRARDFHVAISATYHDQSYATYGADPERKAWHSVTWEIDKAARIGSVDALTIAEDNAQGVMFLVDPTLPVAEGKQAPRFTATLLAPSDPGDQTVPMFSADAQLRHGKFKGIFRQSGYEHQDSYKDDKVIRATLYSLIRIASTMTWSKP